MSRAAEPGSDLGAAGTSRIRARGRRQPRRIGLRRECRLQLPSRSMAVDINNDVLDRLTLSYGCTKARPSRQADAREDAPCAGARRRRSGRVAQAARVDGPTGGGARRHLTCHTEPVGERQDTGLTRDLPQRRAGPRSARPSRRCSRSLRDRFRSHTSRPAPAATSPSWLIVFSWTSTWAITARSMWERPICPFAAVRLRRRSPTSATTCVTPVPTRSTQPCPCMPDGVTWRGFLERSPIPRRTDGVATSS